MINIEPTPCGRILFASMLVVIDGRPALLTSQLPIRFPEAAKSEQARSIHLTRMAEALTGFIVGQASQLGMGGDAIISAMNHQIDLPFERRNQG